MSDEPKSRSEIDKHLSEEERDGLFALVESTTLKEGAAWLRTRYDIDLSPTALGKWAEKRRRKSKDVAFQELLAGLRYDNEQASAVAAEIGSAAQLNDANVMLLGQALFSARRTGDPAEIKNAAKLFAMVLEANAKAKTAEASVIVAETGRNRFQFDAAKAALAHAEELQRINTSKGSEREKIERAILAVFGRHPTQTSMETILAGGNLESDRVPSDPSNVDVSDVGTASNIQAGKVGDASFIQKRTNPIVAGETKDSHLSYPPNKGGNKS